MQDEEIARGAEIELTAPVKATCCDVILPAGARLGIVYCTSPNRVFVFQPSTTLYHKVKRSSLRRAGKLL